MRRPVLGFIALLGGFLFSVASYMRLPPRVAIHWNLKFEPDGYAPRFVAAVVIPSLFLLLPLLAWLLSRIDPRRTSYEVHRKTYWIVWNLVEVLIAMVQVLIIGIALGWNVDMARVLPLLMGLMFVALGNYMGRLRPNWFIGIRTPWTLSSDDVWRRTHRLGGRTMVAGGVVLIFASLLTKEWMRGVAAVAALILAAGLPIVYSYLEWRRGRTGSEGA